MLNSSIISICNDGRYQAGEHPRRDPKSERANLVLVVHSLKEKNPDPTGPKKNRNKKEGILTDYGHCPVCYDSWGNTIDNVYILNDEKEENK